IVKLNPIVKRCNEDKSLLQESGHLSITTHTHRDASVVTWKCDHQLSELLYHCIVGNKNLSILTAAFPLLDIVTSNQVLDASYL
ncbi:hypothetical protein NL489_28555, partial [Klebsiella pneumoniae]|nr:hypothetical protein [Klebsiella pneumoniae]